MDSFGEKNREITITLTSCGRWDLLEQTIKSLVEFWDGPEPERLLIYEDQDLTDQYKTILHSLVRKAIDDQWLFEIYTGKVGQIKAIDLMYAQVETPYIFHCEDDWEFYRTGFIEASFDVLEKYPNCINFWLREPQDTNGHPHRNGILKNNYKGQWGGFTFNPTLKRTFDYRKIVSYSNHTIFNRERPWESESKISMLYRRMGYTARIGEKGFVMHLGDQRHVQ
jgi:hypothetical protein